MYGKKSLANDVCCSRANVKKVFGFFVDRDEFIPIQQMHANAHQMNSF